MYGMKDSEKQVQDLKVLLAKAKIVMKRNVRMSMQSEV